MKSHGSYAAAGRHAAPPRAASGVPNSEVCRGCDSISWEWYYPDLASCELSGADLYGANLAGANLTGANLTEPWNPVLHEAILDAVTWDNTTCPDGTNSDSNGGTCEGHLVP